MTLFCLLLLPGCDGNTSAQTPPAKTRSADGRPWGALNREERRTILLSEFDLSDPKIDLEQLLSGGPPRDGIPALTDLNHESAAAAEFPGLDDRVVEVKIGGHAVAYPLKILNYHEIANDTVGGVPVAVTYCPLCDSVAVLDRRLTRSDGKKHTVEFGVSGMLYNSNVVMYDRTTMGLWSQVLMQAVTGPDAGATLKHLPVRVVTFAQFKAANKGGKVISKDTGYRRDYDTNPYSRYMGSNRVMFPFDTDDRLPAHTLGMGIKAGDQSWFVIADAAKEKPITVDTSLGSVTVTAGDAGVQVDELPDGVSAIQTYFHSWGGFHHGTTIIPDAVVWNEAHPSAAQSSETHTDQK